MEFGKRRASPSHIRLPSPESDHAARDGFAGRQVREPGRTGSHHRQPGARAARDDAVHSRPRRGPRHRLLHHRLPRLPDAQHRQGAVVRQALSPWLQHPLPAGHQRGLGRDRDLGHATGAGVRRLPPRWNLLHVVRQGSGSRPEHGRDPPRPHGGQRPPRRSPGHGRRRPRPHLDRCAGCPRVRLRRTHDAVSLSLHRAGDPELRPARGCALAVLRRLGGLQGDPRHGGCECTAPGGPLRPRHRHPQ